jgi:hypothetical protein
METTPLYDCIAEMLMSGPQSATYYRAAAARAKALQAITTTPRLKQFLAEMVAQYERQAAEAKDRRRSVPEKSIFGSGRMEIELPRWSLRVVA